MMFFRKGRGAHCIIFMSSNAEDRHGFVDLTSIPVLSYASAKQNIKLTEDKNDQ